MKKFILSNISFSKDSISDEMKLIKIKGAFKCDDDKSREILELINTKSTIEVEDGIYSNAISFGIISNCTSVELIQRREREDREKKEYWEEIESKKEFAYKWFEGLGEEEKKYVEILSLYKFIITATG